MLHFLSPHFASNEDLLAFHLKIRTSFCTTKPSINNFASKISIKGPL